MSNPALVERRQWLAYFPQGRIEFLIVTRVLAVLLAAALIVMQEFQRPLVFVALGAVLWVDHVLVIWWLAQIAFDLRQLNTSSESPANEASRFAGSIWATLSISAACCLILPWPAAMRVMAMQFSDGLTAAISVIALIVFIVSTGLAWRELSRMQFGSAVWIVLLMVPGLHWFATHRLVNGLHRRIVRVLESAGSSKEGESPSLPAVAVADVAWVATVLPWLVVTVMTLMRNEWPAALPYSVSTMCATLMSAVLAVANLGALEGLQKSFVRLLNKV
jgi:hypothetical protein